MQVHHKGYAFNSKIHNDSIHATYSSKNTAVPFTTENE